VTSARAISHRVEQLLADLAEVADPAVRDKSEELARSLVELYGSGLERIATVIAGQPGGGELIRTLAADDLVASLLILHDLHPVPVTERVTRALDAVRPQLGLRRLELLGIDAEGVARIAVQGGGCHSSAAAVTRAVERAVADAAPELAGADVVDEVPAPTPVLVQIQPYRPGGVQP
jgi:Fe-S cluster biogenesis protein NfuA